MAEIPISYGSGDGILNNPGHDHRNLIIDHFTRHAISFDKRSGQHVRQTFDEIQALLQSTKDDIVLDVASGTGSLAVEFAKICNKVVGIDLTSGMIEKAKKLQEINTLDNIIFFQILDYKAHFRMLENYCNNVINRLFALRFTVYFPSLLFLVLRENPNKH
jgi:SAM-dependent methyltransferase